jgi:hypothetical protein
MCPSGTLSSTLSCTQVEGRVRSLPSGTGRQTQRAQDFSPLLGTPLEQSILGGMEGKKAAAEREEGASARREALVQRERSADDREHAADDREYAADERPPDRRARQQS